MSLDELLNQESEFKFKFKLEYQMNSEWNQDTIYLKYSGDQPDLNLTEEISYTNILKYWIQLGQILVTVIYN